MPNPWITRRWAMALIFGVALLWSSAAACSRSVPAAFPNGSAASLEAAEAPAVRVGAVLAEDPPLPGEPAAGWPGLDDARPGAAPGAGEHHHHHGAPAPPQATPDGGPHAH